MLRMRVPEILTRKYISAIGRPSSEWNSVRAPDYRMERRYVRINGSNGLGERKHDVIRDAAGKRMRAIVRLRISPNASGRKNVSVV